MGDNIMYAFMCGYYESQIRALVDKAEAETIIARAEERARELDDDFKPDSNDYLKGLKAEL